MLPFMLLAVSVSCREEVPFQYVLQVTVVDESGEPADEVRLSLRNNRTGRDSYTCESKGGGRYEFTGLTETGTYQLWVHERGGDYKDDFTNVTLEEYKTVSVGFRLKRL